MEDSNIKETIHSFFKNKIPRNEQLHFQHWLLKKDYEEEKNASLTQIWDEMEVSADESTYQDLKNLHRRINYLNRRDKSFYISFLRVAAMFILPIIAFTATYIYFKNNTSNIEIVQYYVPKGEVKHLVLSDGSDVWVNSESYLSFPKKFTSKSRDINLIGEAYFQVVKNPKKPFIVHTNDMRIQVLGTKFNVNAYPNISEVKTTLKEGRVEVAIQGGKKEDNFILFPNEEIVYNVKNGNITKKNVDTSNILDWNEGDLIFNSVLLNDVLTQIERKYNVNIAFNSHKYADKRLTVKFENDESIKEVLRVLKLMIPELKINQQDNIIIVK